MSRISESLEKVQASHLYLVAAVLLSLGFALDMISHELWFARSGSLLVALVVLFFAYDVRRNHAYLERLWRDYDDAKFDAEEPLRTARSAAKMAEARGASEQAVSDMKLEPWVDTRDAVRKLRAEYNSKLEAVMKIRRAEAWLIILGTLVWGFGDLLFASEA